MEDLGPRSCLTEVLCVALGSSVMISSLKRCILPINAMWVQIRFGLVLRKRMGVLVVRYCSGEVTFGL